MSKYLDATGVSRLWAKMKTYIAEQISAASGSSEETGEITTIQYGDTEYWGWVLPSSGIYGIRCNCAGADVFDIVEVREVDGALYPNIIGSTYLSYNTSTAGVVWVTSYKKSAYDATGSWKKLM